MKRVDVLKVAIDSKLKNDMLRFIFLTRIKPDNSFKQMENLRSAKKHLENSIIFVQNFIDPKINLEVANYKDEFYLTVENLGRWNKKIDEMSVAIEQFGTTLSGQNAFNALNLKTQNMKESLNEGMENLVYRPLGRSFKRIKIFSLVNSLMASAAIHLAAVESCF